MVAAGTFLDVFAFLGRLVSDGFEDALEERTSNFDDLTWNRAQDRFELAIEARIPDEQRSRLDGPYDVIRYEVACGVDAQTQEPGILEEPRSCGGHPLLREDRGGGDGHRSGQRVPGAP